MAQAIAAGAGQRNRVVRGRRSRALFTGRVVQQQSEERTRGVPQQEQP
jgi:hypothetical protein